MTAATVYKSPSQIHAFAYQYDAFGNLTGRAESAQAGGTLLALLTGTTYGVGASEATDYIKTLSFTATTGTGSNGPSNRLAAVTRGGTLTVNGTGYNTGITQTSATLVYDGNGNVTDDGQFTYTYDAFNRQIAVRSKGTGTPLVAQYVYDAAGERAAAIRYNSAGTAITRPTLKPSARRSDDLHPSLSPLLPASFPVPGSPIHLKWLGDCGTGRPGRRSVFEGRATTSWSPPSPTRRLCPHTPLYSSPLYPLPLPHGPDGRLRNHAAAGPPAVAGDQPEERDPPPSA